MKHILFISRLSTLSGSDIICITVTLLHYLLLLYFNSYILYADNSILMAEMIILFFSISFLHFSSEDKPLRAFKPQFYIWFLISNICFQINLILFLLSRLEDQLTFIEEIITGLAITFLLLLGLNDFLIFPLIVSIFLYYTLLKIVFPEEAVEDKKPYIPLRQMSKYLTLFEQKVYLNTFIITFIIYLLVIFYFVLILFTYIPLNNFLINYLIYEKNIINHLTFGNTTGVISLALAIFSITFPILSKTYLKAREKYSNS